MTTFLAYVGAITVGLIGLALALVLCAILWGYVQAAGGFIRATRIGKRYHVALWKNRKPRLFAVRMIHWQAWHQRTWEISGLDIPWTFVEPVRRAKRFYGG
jgi:hypothetical protein